MSRRVSGRVDWARLCIAKTRGLRACARAQGAFMSGGPS